MDTYSKIQSIFYSGEHAFRGDKESISEISFLVNERYLNLKKIVVASKDDYFSMLDSLLEKEHAYDLASGGGKNHKALKLLATEYLNKMGVKDVQYEQPFFGYYPDVISGNKLIAVECGHTQNPEKMLVYFKQGNIQEFIQIPYPAHEDKEILGYSFSAASNLSEFLKFYEQQNSNHLKKIINRVR
jgi:hypothetical protein